MVTVNTIGNFEAAGNAPGNVPLGAIIAMTTGLTGAMAIPNSGDVSNGYMRCDGVTIPGGNKVSGTPPNLSTSVFIRGATTFGGTGGGTATLTSASQIPTITSTGTVTNTGTTVATTTGAGSAHSHGPGTYNTGVNGAHSNHAIYSRQANYFQAGANRNGLTADDPGGPGSTYVDPGLGDGTHSHDITLGNSASESSHTHSIPSLTVNSGQTVSVTYTNASPSPFNVVPNYIDVVYLIRVS
jgi:hypothetical protein